MSRCPTSALLQGLTEERRPVLGQRAVAKGEECHSHVVFTSTVKHTGLIFLSFNIWDNFVLPSAFGLPC